jgi:hypothetical protein
LQQISEQSEKAASDLCITAWAKALYQMESFEFSRRANQLDSALLDDVSVEARHAGKKQRIELIFVSPLFGSVLQSR